MGDGRTRKDGSIYRSRRESVGGGAAAKALAEKDKEIESLKAQLQAAQDELNKRNTAQQAKPANANVKSRADDINPVKIYNRQGMDVLKGILDTLTVEELHAVIRRNGMDTARRTAKSNDVDRLKNLIMDRAKARAEQGDVFLNYKKD